MTTTQTDIDAWSAYASAPVQPAWDRARVHATETHGVVFARPDRPDSRIVIFVFTATYDDRPGEHDVVWEGKRMTCTAPSYKLAEMEASETWSHVIDSDLELVFASQAEAVERAEHIHLLFYGEDWDALADIDQVLANHIFDWDGQPYEYDHDEPDQGPNDR